MPSQEISLPNGKYLIGPQNEPLAKLALSVPDLFTDSLVRSNTCPSTEPNYIATLVTALYKQEFLDIASEYGIELNNRFMEPISFHDNIPLFAEGQPLDINVSVMAKHAVGTHTALVYQGPLTGVIVSKVKSKPFELGAEAARLWFNDRLGIISYQYPDFLKWSLIQKYIAHDKSHDNCLERMLEIFDIHYQRTITDQVTSNTIYSMNALISLCEQLSIPLDIDQFHATQNSYQRKSFY